MNEFLISGGKYNQKNVAFSTIYTVLYPTFTHDDPSAFNIIKIVNCTYIGWLLSILLFPF